MNKIIKNKILLIFYIYILNFSRLCCDKYLKFLLYKVIIKYILKMEVDYECRRIT